MSARLLPLDRRVSFARKSPIGQKAARLSPDGGEPGAGSFLARAWRGSEGETAARSFPALPSNPALLVPIV